MIIMIILDYYYLLYTFYIISSIFLLLNLIVKSMRSFSYCFMPAAGWILSGEVVGYYREP